MRLRRSRPGRGGIRRTRSGAGFRYTDPTGQTVQDAEVKERISALAIPPAWTDVWISADPLGHIQATGTDAAGRTQYRYHEAWRERRDKTKFNRALELAAVLPRARGAVTRDLRDELPSKRRALAAGFRLLDTASPRVGGERYLEANHSHGLSTLLCSHVDVHGSEIEIRFPGKGGHAWETVLSDPDLASVIRELKERGDRARLLAFEDAGDWHTISATDINEYVRERTHGDFTAKDFRTLRGTIEAATSLAVSGRQSTRRAQVSAITRAMTDASTALGNTPAIARKSYVDPRVVREYRRGRVLDLDSGSPERALRELLRA
jgi:DNA topoisomerase-1